MPGEKSKFNQQKEKEILKHKKLQFTHFSLVKVKVWWQVPCLVQFSSNHVASKLIWIVSYHKCINCHHFTTQTSPRISTMKDFVERPTWQTNKQKKKIEIIHNQLHRNTWVSCRRELQTTGMYLHSPCSHWISHSLTKSEIPGNRQYLLAIAFLKVPEVLEESHLPVIIRHSFGSSSSVISLEIIISGQMRNRISSCTQPYRKTPPPRYLLAKSTCVCFIDHVKQAGYAESA